MIPDDIDVIRRVLAGETDAFDVLVGRHQAAIFRLTYRMTRNLEDAKDLAQDAFVHAYRSLGSFRRRSSFSTWLYRIAMNLCLSHLETAKRADPAEVNTEVPDDREDSLTALLSDEQEQAVAAAISGLPPQQQATLTLRVHQGLSYREIAEVLDCAEGTAKAAYFQAVRALQRRLKDFRDPSATP